MFKIVYHFLQNCVKHFYETLTKETQSKCEKSTDSLFKSTLGMIHNPKRFHSSRSGEHWLRCRRMDDGAEDLWRIHDNLYDFSEFINKHPGGSEWLEFTKGTDITEAFEVHHIQTYPSQMLNNYFVRTAKVKRASPYTFHDDGFYRTLKRRIRPIVKDLPERPVTLSKIYADSLLISTFVLEILTLYFGSYFLAALAGYSFYLLFTCGHNYSHTENNFRMYYWDLSLQSSRELRIIHVLSHHMYPNSIQDYEITIGEPFLDYLPRKKFLSGYFCLFMIPGLYCITNSFQYVRRWIYIFIDGKGANRISLAIFIPLLNPALLYLISYLFFDHISLVDVIYWWILIMHITSFYGGIFTAGHHHHPEIFRDGDTPRATDQMDWGICQLDTIIDRREISTSHFLSLTHFGTHNLHHLFPTVDHGNLPYLLPCAENTCKEFGIEMRTKSTLEMLIGYFMTLINQIPNPVAPGSNYKNINK